MATEGDDFADVDVGSTANKWSKNGFGDPADSKCGGKFTREETAIVRRAVEEYCSTKNISTVRLCSECDHKADLKGAWMEIAQSLPHRTVQSVYRHGLRQLHPFRRGPWTEQECQMLVELVARMGKKWSSIQAKLNRSADSCRDKHREMSSEFRKGRWQENETEKLKRLIRDHLNAETNADIKELGRMVQRQGKTISWSAISKKMGDRSRLSCFKKWQKMTGIYSPSDQHKAGTEPTDMAAAAVAASKAETVASAPGRPVAAASSVVALPASARNAPTAGAAAAAAAAAARAVEPDVDEFILDAVSEANVVRDSEVQWDKLRVEGARDRWNELVGEFQDEEQDNPEVLNLGASDLARHLLDRKRQAKEAASAAETVEALALPNIRNREIVSNSNVA